MDKTTLDVVKKALGGGSDNSREAVSRMKVSFANDPVAVPRTTTYIQPPARSEAEAYSSQAAGLSQLGEFLKTISPSINDALKQVEEKHDINKALKAQNAIQQAMDDGKISPEEQSVIKTSISAISNERAMKLESYLSNVYSSQLQNQLTEEMSKWDLDNLKPEELGKKLYETGGTLVSKMFTENPSLAEIGSLQPSISGNLQQYYDQVIANQGSRYLSLQQKKNKETAQAGLDALFSSNPADSISISFNKDNPDVNVSGSRIPVGVTHLQFNNSTGSLEHVNKLDPNVRDSLDKLGRAYFKKYGTPLRISSAYRTTEENVKVGGAKASKHLKGLAFDIDRGQVENVKALLDEKGSPLYKSLGLMDGANIVWRGRRDVNHFFWTGTGKKGSGKSTPVELNVPTLTSEQRILLASQSNNLKNFMTTKDGKDILKVAEAYHEDVKNGKITPVVSKATEKKAVAIQEWIDTNKMTQDDIAEAALLRIKSGKVKNVKELYDMFSGLKVGTTLFSETFAYKDKVLPAIVQYGEQLTRNELTYAQLQNEQRKSLEAKTSAIVAEQAVNRDLNDVYNNMKSEAVYKSLISQGAIDSSVSYAEYLRALSVSLNEHKNAIYVDTDRQEQIKQEVVNVALSSSPDSARAIVEGSNLPPQIKAELYSTITSVTSTPPYKQMTYYKEGVLGNLAINANFNPALVLAGLSPKDGAKNKNVYDQLLRRADKFTIDLYYGDAQTRISMANRLFGYVQQEVSKVPKEEQAYFKGLLFNQDGSARKLTDLTQTEQRSIGQLVANFSFVDWNRSQKATLPTPTENTSVTSKGVTTTTRHVALGNGVTVEESQSED